MRTHKIVAALPTFTEAHRRRITEAAAARGYTVEWYPDALAAVPHVADAEIILTNLPDPARHAPLLRWFCTSNAGVDVFLREGVFASPDAVLTNSHGAYGVTISEHIVMTALFLMRRMLDYRQVTDRRGWRRDLPIRAIKGSRVTLLGTGDIGSEAARRLRAFEPASLTGVSRSGRQAGTLFDRMLPVERLDEALPETDLLILSLPETLDTVRLVDARRLALLPETAFLINVGRGTSIDQQALADALAAGRLAGAALDVFEEEPLPPDDPLWDCPRLLITPHVAGNTTLPYTVDRIVSLFLEDFENYCEGRPLVRAIDRQKGY